MSKALPLCLLSLSSLALWSAPLEARQGYQLPPQAIVDLIDAEPTPSVRFSPDGERILFETRDAMPSLADVARPMLRLAGMRIDPSANAPHRTSFGRGLVLFDPTANKSWPMPIAEGARLASVDWSHDSQRFAYTLVTDEGSELWVCGVEPGAQPRRLSARLHTLFTSPEWMPDGKSLLIAEVPEGRGAEPSAPRVPAGPNIQSTAGEASPLRTYQDLLQNAHDEELFAHYARNQLAIVDVAGGRRALGAADLITGAEPSPDGSLVLVNRMRRPFSYLMPYYQFPQSIEVWSIAGEPLARIAEVPLQEGIPIGGVRTGRRNVQWREGAPAELVWVEALDGGDPKREVEHRDRWMLAAAPFEGEGRELFRLQHRARGLEVLEDPTQVIASEYDRDRRWTRSWLIDLSNPSAEWRALEDRSVRDRYAEPGRLLTRVEADGRRVPVQHGPWVYRSGSGASPEGLLPFLDRQNLETLETERLWRCEPGSYESVVRLLEPESEGALAFITRRETPTSPPNYWRRDLAGTEPAMLTSFADPTPQIRGVHKELVTYERSDGVPLSATLYLPADHEQGQRLPLLVWAYPIEFNDPSTAGQVTSSPWRFTRIGGLSHLALLTQGYAVMDGATMPVIGDAETMNDTFIEQIVDAASAAIDKAVDLGVADRQRVAVGGHSYGAFMTANLLAHSDLFRAGVARSGAYNRTLTPFGFQSERRTFWEAPEIYFQVSPFMHAQKIDEPLLMIHGEVDNNSGTFPMQSQRLFQAIKGNGGTARLVMLPHESHGYRARASVLHVHAETVDWLDEHVKRAPVIEASATREER